MIKEKTTLLKAVEFAHENGYLYAVYEKQDNGDFHKIEDAIFDAPVDDNTEVIVKNAGESIDFKEFESTDGRFLFRMHNNFNVPNIIPISQSQNKLLLYHCKQ